MLRVSPPMLFSRVRLAAAMAMTAAAATASSLALVGTARADDTQSGSQSDSWVPVTTIPLANAKSVEASSVIVGMVPHKCRT